MLNYNFKENLKGGKDGSNPRKYNKDHTMCWEKKWKLRAKLEELVKEQHQEVRKLIKVKI